MKRHRLLIPAEEFKGRNTSITPGTIIVSARRPSYFRQFHLISFLAGMLVASVAVCCFGAVKPAPQPLLIDDETLAMFSKPIVDRALTDKQFRHDLNVQFERVVGKQKVNQLIYLSAVDEMAVMRRPIARRMLKRSLGM